MNTENAVLSARKQYEAIDRCIGDVYTYFYSLNKKPGEEILTKEDLVKAIHEEVISTLRFICHENEINDTEDKLIFAAEDPNREFYIDFSAKWIKEYQEANGNEFPLIGSMGMVLTIDDKFHLNGQNSRTVFRALIVLFSLIIEADDDETKRISKTKIAQGLVDEVLATEEARRLQIDIQRPVVKNKKHILDNMAQMDCYLSNMDNYFNRRFALERIKLGTCFIAVKVHDGFRFYPSRFIGYINNSRTEHESDFYKDGMETNRAIESILQKKPVFRQDMEDEYYKYCYWLGIEANNTGAWGVQRKYWIIEG